MFQRYNQRSCDHSCDVTVIDMPRVSRYDVQRKLNDNGQLQKC